MITTTLLTLALLIPSPPEQVPPSVELPEMLVKCVYQAARCAAEADTEPAFAQCISDYEDCSYDFDEAHEDSCQMDHIWCLLEPQVYPEWIDYCAEVIKTCPNF